MRLKQGQVYKREDEYIRIVKVERLAVDYKSMLDVESGEGTHHHATKKEFCRLIKDAELQSE